MATFKVKIITPEREAFSGEATKIVARTTVGDVGLMARHVNYVAGLGIGAFTLISDEGTKYGAAASGFVSFVNNEATIVTDFFEWADEIDVSRAEKAMEKAKTEISNKKEKSDLIAMEIKLKKALNRIDVSKM